VMDRASYDNECLLLCAGLMKGAVRRSGDLSPGSSN